jgi:hypothetical protein
LRFSDRYPCDASITSLYAYILYSLHVHAIGASEGEDTYEIERVNPEDPENTQEMEVQPAGHGEPE